MKFSILTATYNRANCLEKLYKSLIGNVSKNGEYLVEWLIMDDGSTDETEVKCRDFKSVDGLEVKYYRQDNQGKMSAINNLASFVTGDLWIECDSDDYFVEGCFSGIVEEYKKIKDRNDIYAIAYLKRDQDGNNMGNNFKSSECTMFDLYFKELEDGEKALVFIASVRAKYKYELESGERFITEARMYHKMDVSYKMICINETIMVCEYQNEGYTKNIQKQFLSNPHGYYEYFYEILHDMDTSKIKLSKRLYVIKHYILFTYLTHKKLNLRD